MTVVQSTSRISPAMERVYHQSNLLGEWKGSWTASSQAVSFKVVNIRGAQATVKSTHNGRTGRGIGEVNAAPIVFGSVALGPKDAKTAVLLFSAGGGRAPGMLEKQAPPASESNLV